MQAHACIDLCNLTRFAVYPFDCDYAYVFKLYAEWKTRHVNTGQGSVSRQIK